MRRERSAGGRPLVRRRRRRCIRFLRRPARYIPQYRRPECGLDAIARCWASGHADHVRQYRERHGLHERPVRVAVLVQQLVPADVSGVVFSANPVNGQRDELVINASWGLGESVVAGRVTPDAYIVRRTRPARHASDDRRQSAHDGADREWHTRSGRAPAAPATAGLDRPANHRDGQRRPWARAQDAMAGRRGGRLARHTALCSPVPPDYDARARHPDRSAKPFTYDGASAP